MNNRFILFLLHMSFFSFQIFGMDLVKNRIVPANENREEQQEKKIVSFVSRSNSVSLPKDFIRTIMTDHLSLQSIGRLGQTCRDYNDCYHDLMVCKTPHNDQCSSVLCTLLANDREACRRALIFYAKKYKKNKKKSDAQVFQRIFYHVNNGVDSAVSDILNTNDLTWKDCIHAYSGNCYTKREMETIMREKNSLKLKRLLCQNNISAAKIMVLAKHGFDLRYVGRKYFDRDKSKTLNLLEYALLVADVEILAKLLRINDVNFEWMYFEKAFAYAFKKRKGELVDFLLCQKNDQISENRFKLFDLVVPYRFRILEIINSLFSDDINAVDEKGKSILHYYVANSNCCGAGLDILSERGIKIDSVDNDAKTALHYLAKHHFFNDGGLTRKLVQNGVPVDAVDTNGQTALHYAIKNGSVEIMEELIEAGANVNLVDGNGNTSLLIMVQARGAYRAEYEEEKKRTTIKKVDLLLRNNANLQATDKSGRMALHFIEGLSEWNYLYQKYIQAGICVKQVDKNKKTTFDVIHDAIHREINSIIAQCSRCSLELGMLVFVTVYIFCLKNFLGES